MPRSQREGGAKAPGGRAGAERLTPDFFARPTLLVARELLGCTLKRRLDGVTLAARIVETEAYIGEADLACHASRGRTARNDPLYREPGTLYVYFTYGMHWLLNVVTEREGVPAAVLLRAAVPSRGLAAMRSRRPGRRDHELLRGPASLCRALGVDGTLNGLTVDGPELWIVRGVSHAPRSVRATPRIGIDYAGSSRRLPWRFVVRDEPAASGPRRLR